MRLCVSAIVSLSFLAGSAANGQILPGGSGSSASQMRVAHSSFVRGRVDVVLLGLEKALNEGDASKTAALYAKDATIVTASGALVQGRGAVRDRYAVALPRMEGVEVRVAMFDASGDFAYVIGTLRYAVRYSSGAVAAVEEPVTFLLRSVNDTWFIQTHSGGHLPSVVRAHAPVPEQAAPGDSVRVGVQVADASGESLRNVVVTFDREAGGVVIDRRAVTTDAAGNASTMLRIGEEPGVVVVRATAVGVSGDPVIFRINAQAARLDEDGGSR